MTQTTLTWDFLRCYTGEFDPEIIFHLFLQHRNIEKIQALEPLTHLRRLDLSHNRITRLEGLGRLKELQILDVSHNQLTKVEGLQGLAMLETFKACGNQFTRFQDLTGLSAPPKLRAVYLANPDASDACPITLASDYRTRMPSIAPKLQVLDGHRLHLPLLAVSPLVYESLSEDALSLVSALLPVPLLNAETDLCLPECYEDHVAESVLDKTMQPIETAMSEAKKVLKSLETLTEQMASTSVDSEAALDSYTDECGQQ
ncbi:unnamed protein product [Vitrella brassicaformis CCMP3155]|uniref:U2A'/phosphoprotein 32 family A C-terminal domain-containing protein n=1 Tax=Vitrella brassicaformis (strain CCMP3155) TaxID=1169540 RepID=A0A0G4EU70_VITBC|nr:unnamed protein product [Vitrella brassicaformis CCMP3155]|eukprot:CEM02193.1 unnamed protein product [Vitrella brassicaformis CCMP3155]